MKKPVIVLSLILCVFSLKAQNSTDSLTTTFFKKYEQNTDEAFDFIFSTNKWMSAESEGILNVKNKIKQYAQLMGEYIGPEKLIEKRLGKSLKIIVYMVKYERQPLRFVFMYYKAKQDWKIYNLKFDEDIDDDLEELLKYEYLMGN